MFGYSSVCLTGGGAEITLSSQMYVWLALPCEMTAERHAQGVDTL